MWLLGGVDNLSTILDENKPGKRLKKKEREANSNLFNRMTTERTATVPQCNFCRMMAVSSESFSICGSVRECFIVEGNVRRRIGLPIDETVIQK